MLEQKRSEPATLMRVLDDERHLRRAGSDRLVAGDTDQVVAERRDDRHPPVDPLTEAQARGLLGERGRPLNIFLSLAKNEPLFTSFMNLGGYLLGKRFGIERRERELVILRVGWRSGSDYEFGQHTVIGKQ